MAMPTGLLSSALKEIDQSVIAVKGLTSAINTAATAGFISSSSIFAYYARLKAERNRLNTLQSKPGLAAYAQSQYNNGALNIAAEFTLMFNAIDATLAWIETNLPKDGNGFLLISTLGTNGPVDRQFSQAETAGFRTQLAALLATIN